MALSYTSFYFEIELRKRRKCKVFQCCFRDVMPYKIAEFTTSERLAALVNEVTSKTRHQLMQHD